MHKRIKSTLLLTIFILCSVLLSTFNISAVNSYSAFNEVKIVLSENTKGENINSYSGDCEYGSYKLSVTYMLKSTGDSALTFSVKIDGSYPDNTFSKLSLHRFWTNEGDVREDKNGNQFAAKQTQVAENVTDYVYNGNDLDSADVIIMLETGFHTIDFSDFSDKIEIEAVELVKVTASAYSDTKKSYENSKSYSGQPIYIQGEDAVYKSAKNIVPKCDNTDASIIPSSTTTDVVNYIGSSAWQTPGDQITWEFTVSESGVYALGFKYRQSLVENANSYRALMIDGVEECVEYSRLKFEYSRKWQFTAAKIDDEPLLIYLEKGSHTLSLTVTMGEISELVNKLSDEIEKIGQLYRKIVMITGESPDAARSYNLFDQIPQFNEQLEAMNNSLSGIANSMESLSGKGQSNVATIRSMCTVLNKMLENPYSAHEYKSSYYSQYCSLSSCLYEMVNMPLDIDYIALYKQDGDLPENKVNVFSSVAFHIKKFLSSFSEAYTFKQDDSDNAVKLWINSGRDQAQVLGNLITTDFTVNSGISVSLKLTDASVIQAILSGNGPDCILNLARSEPVNLAMRGALYNLSSFEDFGEVTSRFAATALEPYEYQGGYYALPDTQSFSMMFYRTDILEELACSVPQTWEEYLTTLAVLQRNNLQAGVGSNDINMYATLLMQNGGSLYTADKKNINLDDEISIKAFTQWCSFFTDYKMPVTADYYNRFRVGIMPIIVTNYTMYITLKVAAPEIDGKWKMVEIPGTLDESGNIDNSQSSTGTGCVILKDAKNPSGAWEFLKWWTSSTTQLSYSQEVETVIGVSGRVATANVEALSKMSWDSDSSKEILSQWSKINDIPEIPGGYYVSRVITQAYWNVVSNGQDARDTLSKWSDVAEAEILRKRSQYNLN